MNLDRTAFLALLMTTSVGTVGCGSAEPSQPAAAEAPAQEVSSGAEQAAEPAPAEPPASEPAPPAAVDPVVEQTGPTYE